MVKKIFDYDHSFFDVGHAEIIGYWIMDAVLYAVQFVIIVTVGVASILTDLSTIGITIYKRQHLYQIANTL